MTYQPFLGDSWSGGLIDFRQEFRKIYTTTNVTKFRSFQYRLLQRALVTNIHLQKWGLIDTCLCSFCGSHKETVLHILWECEFVRDLWNNVCEYIEKRFRIVIRNVTEQDNIFNSLVQGNHAANYLCLVHKTVYI